MFIDHVFSLIYDSYLYIHCYLVSISKILHHFRKTYNNTF